MSQQGSWVGYRVWEWCQERWGGQSWQMPELAAADGAGHVCSGCDRPVAAIHDRALRRIRDLPLFEPAVELVLSRLRLACPRRGPGWSGRTGSTPMPG